MPAPTADRRRICLLMWRDTDHPDGGGSEVYVEHMARWLAARGHDVTVVCAAHAAAPADELRDGVRFRRRGGRLTVYLHGLAYLLGRGRRTDVVVDVANGVPFFTPLVRRRGLRTLVHHVHREQWQIIFPGLRGSIGWWIESRVAPVVYRRVPYMTVSEASRADLGRLGVAPERIRIVHNGIDVPHPSALRARSATPRVCVLGRLVPHKQVEHALETVASLRHAIPDLRLDVVGDGWWSAPLRDAAERAGVDDLVTFHGHVSDRERDALLDSAWLLLVPSVKEGWGIVIMEAAARGVPALAYAHAGGVTEAIVDGETGVLVADRPALTAETARLLTDTEARLAMGKAARERAQDFGWTASCAAFERWVLQGE
ncbi:Glycosyltransferase involved in cell wall bisynthesis [Jatrophihabitans endophyticus]|uniref:Glycosyltransferase involved in cell wall bisynthesis n=1 Tax=Jatrophihabitans endophyticus TaxID=1206085 RepID=A0A1M5CXD9_9ACTN|nr:glycosyltransferase family 4 protein [Jatrophihabitans endophyticus]SHF59277.1 Glycosyltransferase involved in cell wall bisynthesis [Jatrophihabitans endophyticus]